MAGELQLKAWLHPTIAVPFKLDVKDLTFSVSPGSTIMSLMEKCEALVEKLADKEGKEVQMQIQVLWNVKNANKALSPQETVGASFADGDTFGVYGDVMDAPAAPVRKAEEEKLPVTILTGFLGSGKTTLLNYILQEQREMKIAIIENEFGEISIDDALLKQEKMSMAEKIVVMDNGCMCCTIRGDLVNGLKSILDSIKQGGHIDCVLIETTGMADPVPIVRTFMSNPELTCELRLDAVIAMADAKNLEGRLNDFVEEGKVNEAYQQIAFADKIILNKLDLIDTDQAIAIKDKIREINKFAKILPAVKGRVKISELANIRAHDMTNFVNEDIEMEAEVPAELEHGHGGHGDAHGDGGHGGHGGHGHDADCKEEHGDGGHGGHGGGHGGDAHGSGHGEAKGHGHGRATAGNRHDSRVNSFSIAREGEILPFKLKEWMQMLGQLPPDKGTVFRIKAILAVKGHPYKHVFHAVMDVSDEDDAGPWAEGEKKISKIVFIGKCMDEPYLRQGFNDIFEK